jgi:NADPH-dependent glutamate synthase beta subunit-like oxidoreductase
MIQLKDIVGDQQLKYCNHCGECISVCPAAKLSKFRPRRIAAKVQLDMIEELFKSDEVLLCALCGKCHVCPREVTLPESFLLLRKLASEQDYLPDMLSKFVETLKTLREEVPFPIVYSWLCLRPREDESNRRKFDDLVLNVLEHFIIAYKEKVVPLSNTRKEKIAIIGSGPAGLTAAWELVRMGFPVTVFESLPEPGGMLRVGIPEYRLPKKILDIEIGYIKDLGVEIKTNNTVDKDVFTNFLTEGKYKAIFIATGAHRSGKLGVEGEDLEGVIYALDLLRQTNLQKLAKLGKRVVVIGGGNVAMDATRTALRYGAEKVQLACLESKEEIPAHEWEIQEALMEGVTLNVSCGPKKILGDGKRVTGVELMRCVSVFDIEGRFKPSFQETSIKVLEADTVILAIGQTPDLSFLGEKVEVLGNTIAVNPVTMETNLPGVFAGGDSVSGPASVIEAMVAGKLVAASIDLYLRGVN